MMYSSANSFCFKLIFTNFPSPLFYIIKKRYFKRFIKVCIKIIYVTFQNNK
nr:MAG TPA: hypothetical protein [Caudoviricetes sp.]